MEERLQKYLARCGVASRRRSEELITAGKVDVDGVTVTALGTKIDPETQVVVVQGEKVKPAPFAYYAVHKPSGVVCTHHDPAGRPLAVNLVPSRGMRLFPIGRLDEDSEGLLLLTNDGELAERVAHPRFQVSKKYLVTVKGTPDKEALDKLRKGVWLAEGKTAPASIQVVRKTREQTQLMITLHEGKKRHIRRVLARVELPVRRLRRIQVGPIRLGTLKRGQWRTLRRDEIEALRAGIAHIPFKKERRGRSSARTPRKARPAGSAPSQNPSKG